MDLIIWLAIGLGMDAFSASIAIGAQGISDAKKWGGSLLVGFFHIIMPLIGMLIGSVLSTSVSWIGAALLLAVGIQMIRSGFMGRAAPSFVMTVARWFAFSFGVSIDSLSVGVTLGITNMDTWNAVILFGVASAIMTRAGLQIGQVLNYSVGRYSEVIGGSILLAIAFRMMVSG